VAEVIAVAADHKDTGVRVGDWVLPARAATGTWRSHAIVAVDGVARLDKTRLSVVQAATLTVNPCSAYRMLRDFADLKPGDWVIQNGANSAVGQAVIQIAHARGFRTANIVRDRENFSELQKMLQEMGADRVFRDTELRLPETRAFMEEAKPKLGLNCIGGKTTTELAQCLGHGAYLVTYGGMSREPVTIPTTLFIFKDLRSVGFWLTNWSASATMEQRRQMFGDLTEMYAKKQLREPAMEEIKLAGLDDKAATAAVRDAMRLAESGFRDRKVLLRMS